MDGLGFTGGLARLSARRPWTTLGIWVLIVGGATWATTGIGDVLTQEQDLLVETESEQAQTLIDEAREAAGVEVAMQEFVLVTSDRAAGVDDPDVQRATATLVDDLRAAEHVAGVVGPQEGAPVSTDRTIGMIQVTLDTTDWAEAAAAAEPMLQVVEDADAGAVLDVTTVGTGSLNIEFNDLAEQTLRRGEAVALPIALVILVVVFGAVVAGLLPLLIAGLSIVLAMGLTVLVGQVTDLNFFIVNMITMIGLAVGIDYSLLVVQRFREERLAGRPVVDAVAVAGATATRAVSFSGVTVVIALLGLMIMPDTTMRSLGIGAILVVIASLLVALTLLPALLGLLGDRINRLRVPFTHRGTDDSHRFWTRITRSVTARPIVSVVLAAGLLLAAAAPFLTMDIGNNFIASLPEDSDSRIAFETLNEEFLGGVITTPIVVSADDVSDPAIASATEALVTTLEADEAYGTVTVTPTPRTDLLLLEATTLVDPSTAEGRDAITRLRDDQIPEAFADTDAEVLVAGDAAFMTDFVDVINSRTPLIFTFVLGLSFLLLLLAFRSIVVPLKAIVMNLLSVGAAYGLLVLVFQHGVGADLLGLQQTDVIESWVPLFLFAVLFGLSMDYHVFLLSRIKERYDVTGDNSGSVAFGLSVTGSIITGAALIMVAVFGGFAAGDLVMFQQMGFGLGVAVILDATIVRSVLVPAAMELLGDRNWYFPRWLEWLPEVHVEGTRHIADEDVIVLPSDEPAAMQVPRKKVRR
jgi:RND superfamily putative drug exporter